MRLLALCLCVALSSAASMQSEIDDMIEELNEAVAKLLKQQKKKKASSLTEKAFQLITAGKAALISKSVSSTSKSTLSDSEADKYLERFNQFEALVESMREQESSPSAQASVSAPSFLIHYLEDDESRSDEEVKSTINQYALSMSSISFERLRELKADWISQTSLDHPESEAMGKIGCTRALSSARKSVDIAKEAIRDWNAVKGKMHLAVALKVVPVVIDCSEKGKINRKAAADVRLMVAELRRDVLATDLWASMSSNINRIESAVVVSELPEDIASPLAADTESLAAKPETLQVESSVLLCSMEVVRVLVRALNYSGESQGSFFRIREAETEVHIADELLELIIRAVPYDQLTKMHPRCLAHTDPDEVRLADLSMNVGLAGKSIKEYSVTLTDYEDALFAAKQNSENARKMIEDKADTVVALYVATLAISVLVDNPVEVIKGRPNIPSIARLIKEILGILNWNLSKYSSFLQKEKFNHTKIVVNM